MVEQLISFNTAKLAKEKGFSYTTTKYLFGSRAGILEKQEETIPTQSLLQAWLRKEHQLYVEVKAVNKNEKIVFYASFYDFKKLYKKYVTKSSLSYENALEKCLFEGLKRI